MALFSRGNVWAVALALGTFMLISMMLYLSVESNARRRTALYGDEEGDKFEERQNAIRRRIETLKSEVVENRKLLEELGKKLERIGNNAMNDGGEERRNGLNGGENADRNQNGAQKEEAEEIEGRERGVLRKPLQQQQIQQDRLDTFRAQICAPKDAAMTHNATTDVQMLSLYDILPFDNPDGGVWKQGWPITYDPEKIRTEKRLEVVVIPHSHNDPGWLKTFEGYFEDQTRHILDGMVKHLADKSDLKFIYAEMSFFELWWSQQTEEVKKRVAKFLEEGQLEIVTGGWVMTDEANAHFFATVTELFEGHEFLQNQLGYTPRHHWSIDPFGLSPTLSYVLNRANLTHMAIQRVHYSVKKHLARHKQLEFVWRQLFSTSVGGQSGDTQRQTHSDDIVAHMFPFYSYDAPHSCGPDPKVCCQFDFRRLGHGPISCPWGVNPVPITADNVAERAQLLADQYRKKAQLYGHNILLVPLGDDFRFDEDSEWTDQYANYKLLFEFMNGKKEWNINARFGTLGDYFDALERRLVEKQADDLKREGILRHSVKKPENRGALSADSPSSAASLSLLPLLSGDFFTYADRDDHYWSGFFTSRPFYKHMDRTLQHLLRAADIFYTMARWESKGNSEKGEEDGGDFDLLFDPLVRARRALSLFQHHDGVTGTARTNVMTDYGEKMLQALEDSKRILAKSVQRLLAIPKLHLRVDEAHFVDRLPQKVVLGATTALAIANPMGHGRREVICVHVDSVERRIESHENTEGSQTDTVPQQIGPVLFIDLRGHLAHFHDKFELCFVAQLPPFGMAHFRLVESSSQLGDGAQKATIRQSKNSAFESRVFDSEPIKSDEQTVTLRNSHLVASFDASSGLLRSIRQEENAEIGVELSFVHYGARTHDPNRAPKDLSGDSRSGAYLFLPDGPAKPLSADGNSFLVVSGPVRQYVHIKGPVEVGIRHQIALDVDARHLTILNNVNLATESAADRGDRAQHGANIELAMRLRVPSMRQDNFFTDLNGFQMIRRRRQPQLPLQAHFYPMPGAAFIEDADSRLSLLGRQALGVASLEKGEMQVMLDRRLAQDDDRGLGQGVEDNLLTESRFHLLLEHFDRFSSPPPSSSAEGTIAFHSLAAHHSSLRLHYPPISLAGQMDDPKEFKALRPFVSVLRHSFPCNFHPVTLRTLSHPTVYSPNSSSTRPRDEAALILHRFGIECRLGTPLGESNCLAGMATAEGIDAFKLFDGRPRTVRRGSLTLLYTNGTNIGQGEQIAMEPMELATLRVAF
ncbi:hypothetical protein niasHS_017014 [Heterodera schachtii]|uniref:Alpha-mannosidase n=1 Tax=Heterodera schachtii TaxID=97005 RepID=A0ABD2HRT7_HETSC